MVYKIKPYPVNSSVPKMLSVFMSAAYLQVHFRLDLIMEANTITLIRLLLREQSDLSPYC